ncbi:FAD-dependent oxidoreductase [Desulfoluna spongiiphila]|uniref:2,4-dienoyl-CoA reductase (NADPH2) n=1 Tax=Desulfoluna spongiiphila TaxID=419481 RepID=A0A1G5JNX6_9BACT|nr:FAD-dependent oxidoreductase [Desulfoluna spongiiphila]SCY90083.1 2,4-dienoyl-CoA reductase (NADPH2) [Desulfoluna spongiiphila]
MRDPIYEPIRINGLELKNRICLPAMHLGMCEDFLVSDRLVAFYAERAKGGAGLIVVGNATVDERSGNSMYIGAHLDAHLPGLTRLAAAINGNGACSAVQLNHAGRYSHSLLMGGKSPVAPSAIASRMTGEEPEALTLKGIRGVVTSFADAAARVKQAGFNAVEILAGTGYLLSEFLSPLTNTRDDAYGGSLENRMRLGLEIVAAIRGRVGADFPVMVRLDNNDFMEGGTPREELETYAVRLVEAGADALCVKGGWHEARVPQLTPNVPRGMYGYLARNVKEKVRVPVIASHRINDPAVARELIDEGCCDMVAMGRSLIADPYLPEKARTGREQEILHCIACAQGCFDNLFKLKHVECLCNPRAGHEWETAPLKAATPRRVMVIGGGAAGMSAALAAHEKGHAVTLYEKSPRLGGQLHLAAAPPGRREFLSLATDLGNQLAATDIRLVLNTAVDETILAKENPDHVVLATGAEPLTPPIPGVGSPHVVQAWDVLAGTARTGKKVVIIGGGAVGVETALFLAEKGTLSAEAVKCLLVNGGESPETLRALASRGSKEVVLIEMGDRVGRDIGKSTRWGMLQEMGRSRVTVRTGARALAITDEGVRVQCGEEIKILVADTVVLASGAVPVNPFAGVLEAKGIACSVVGDARGIALAFDAVHQGFAAGRAVD